MSDVTVIGAAGRTGRPLVQRLIDRGVAVRALVRSPRRADNFADGISIVVVDLGDAPSLIPAFAGSDVVHFIPPLFTPDEETYAANAIEAAVAAKVGRFVYHSVLHADTPQMPHHARKARVERMLRDSPLTWTILQPAMYVSTPWRFFDTAQRAFRPPFSVERKFSPIDDADLAEATANILSGPGHEFAVYELAGPKPLDFIEMAELASRIAGRTVKAVAATPEDALRGRGFSDGAELEARAMYAHYDAHGLPGNGRVLEMLLGRQPRSFEQSLEVYSEPLKAGSQGLDE